MDVTASKYLHPRAVGGRKDDPWDDVDPATELFPMAKKAVTKSSMVEGPPTPGRPVFSFSIGSRKNFPSKWDDAEKWVISGSDSPARDKNSLPVRQQRTEVPTTVSFHGSDSSHLLLKDKFTDDSKVKCLVPMNQAFVLAAMKDASTEVVERRDSGRIMIPSPPRHNTPATMSGPLPLNSSFDIANLHLCNWASREEEKDDISKSLRHLELKNECQKTIQEDEPRACDWEEEERSKSHLRYQREEAKIQAWVNLQNAKAEAQSRKLEVKIQKMRCKFEEKMMRKMTIVDKRAEELRAAAQAKKSSGHGHGGCFP